MIILRYITHSINRYVRLYQDVPPLFEEDCPCCGQKLHKHGKYHRSVASKEEMIKIPIYRWICSGCRITISLLPDFISPYKVFTVLIQEKFWVSIFLKGKSYSAVFEAYSPFVSGGISLQTIRRWRRNWRRIHEPLVHQVLREILNLEPNSSPHKIIQKHPIEKALQYLIEKFWKIIHPGSSYPFFGILRWLYSVFYPRF